eukprot:4825770-Pyramimonas_sp.AAC.1
MPRYWAANEPPRAHPGREPASHPCRCWHRRTRKMRLLQRECALHYRAPRAADMGAGVRGAPACVPRLPPVRPPWLPAAATWRRRLRAARATPGGGAVLGAVAPGSAVGDAPGGGRLAQRQVLPAAQLRRRQPAPAGEAPRQTMRCDATRRDMNSYFYILFCAGHHTILH